MLEQTDSIVAAPAAHLAPARTTETEPEPGVEKCSRGSPFCCYGEESRENKSQSRPVNVEADACARIQARIGGHSAEFTSTIGGRADRTEIES